MSTEVLQRTIKEIFKKIKRLRDPRMNAEYDKTI